jgi:hypothetical protein
MKKSKKTTTNHFKRWGSKEDSELKEAIDAGYDVRETATLLGRTVAAIHTRKSQLFSAAGDERRFPITDRKDTTHRLLKFNEFDEEQQKLIRRELLITSREELGDKWSIDQRTFRQFPDVNSGDALRAQHATQLFSTKQEAADHLGIHTRTLYRRLQGIYETPEGAPELIEDIFPLPPDGTNTWPPDTTADNPPEEPSPLPWPIPPSRAEFELNSAALLVRDVVIALKPYGISCSFEFEGDQVTKMTANFV